VYVVVSVVAIIMIVIVGVVIVVLIVGGVGVVVVGMCVCTTTVWLTHVVYASHQYATFDHYISGVKHHRVRYIDNHDYTF